MLFCSRGDFPQNTLHLTFSHEKNDADAEEFIPTGNRHGDELARDALVAQRQRPTMPKGRSNHGLRCQEALWPQFRYSRHLASDGVTQKSKATRPPVLDEGQFWAEFRALADVFARAVATRVKNRNLIAATLALVKVPRTQRTDGSVEDTYDAWLQTKKETFIQVCCSVSIMQIVSVKLLVYPCFCWHMAGSDALHHRILVAMRIATSAAKIRWWTGWFASER